MTKAALRFLFKFASLENLRACFFVSLDFNQRVVCSVQLYGPLQHATTEKNYVTDKTNDGPSAIAGLITGCYFHTRFAYKNIEPSGA